MGAVQGSLFSPDFNLSVDIEAQPERLSADGGALLLRDLTDRLDLPTLAQRYLGDPAIPIASPIPSSSCCAPRCCCSLRAGGISTTPRSYATIRSSAWRSRPGAARDRFAP